MLTAIIEVSKKTFASNKRLRQIDEQDKKIIFSYGKKIVAALIASESSQILMKKLDKFVYEFEQHHKSLLENWNGDIGVFSHAWILVKKIFPIQKWQY
ncbi:MAG: hypothetical protein ACP6IY_17035 [Promethearchaeia archaeon]